MNKLLRIYFKEKHISYFLIFILSMTIICLILKCFPENTVIYYILLSTLISALIASISSLIAIVLLDFIIFIFCFIKHYEAEAVIVTMVEPLPFINIIRVNYSINGKEIIKTFHLGKKNKMKLKTGLKLKLLVSYINPGISMIVS